MIAYQNKSSNFEENRDKDLLRRVNNVSPKIIEDQFEYEIDIYEGDSNSAGKKENEIPNFNNQENNFLIDSLNERKSIIPERNHNQENIKCKTVGVNKENTFLNALQTAIRHFEKENNINQNKRQLQQKDKKYNVISDKLRGDFSKIKKDYCSLQLKYSELKIKNKVLMNDYANLRSQIEEMKAVHNKNYK